MYWESGFGVFTSRLSSSVRVATVGARIARAPGVDGAGHAQHMEPAAIQDGQLVGPNVQLTPELFRAGAGRWPFTIGSILTEAAEAGQAHRVRCPEGDCYLIFASL